MMAITTNSSTKVNAPRLPRFMIFASSMTLDEYTLRRAKRNAKEIYFQNSGELLLGQFRPLARAKGKKKAGIWVLDRWIGRSFPCARS